MAEVIIENGELVLKNFMTIKQYNNLLMDTELEAKKNILGDLNKIVNELMENPLSSVKMSVNNRELIPELIKVLKPHKFTQHKECKNELLSTKGYLLVEGNKNDVFWGVGLDVNDPAIYDMGNWKGFNYLGFILTDIRFLIKE